MDKQNAESDKRSGEVVNFPGAEAAYRRAFDRGPTDGAPATLIILPVIRMGRPGEGRRRRRRPEAASP